MVPGRSDNKQIKGGYKTCQITDLIKNVFIYLNRREINRKQFNVKPVHTCSGV